MTPAEVMRAALCEARHPELAGYVVERAGRRLVMFNVPVDRRLTDNEARAVHHARAIAYTAFNISTDNLISEDDYVKVCKQARRHVKT